MIELTNSTQARTRFLSLSRQLREEAERWRGDTRAAILEAARLAFTAGMRSGCTSLATSTKHLAELTDVLVMALTERAGIELDRASA